MPWPMTGWSSGYCGRSPEWSRIRWLSFWWCQGQCSWTICSCRCSWGWPWGNSIIHPLIPTQHCSIEMFLLFWPKLYFLIFALNKKINYIFPPSSKLPSASSKLRLDASNLSIIFLLRWFAWQTVGGQRWVSCRNPLVVQFLELSLDAIHTSI